MTEILKCDRLEIVCLPFCRIFGRKKNSGESRTIGSAFEFEFELDFEVDFELDFELKIALDS